MNKIATAALATALTLVTGTVALAERMSGKDVAALMAKGPIEFQAGSVWETQASGRYVFTHTRSGEEGSFKLFKNGEVHAYDDKTGMTIKFYFDLGAEGVPTLVYLNGGGKGKRYPIK